MKICCFTGHRNLNMDVVNNVNNHLYNLIGTAIESGYTHFISGFANGVDLMAASIVINYRESMYSNKNITLEAAIPYRGMLDKKDHHFQGLLDNCDKINVISENYYTGCMHKRNLAMIEKSDMLIAVYDGRKGGGTRFTIDAAIKHGLEVSIIKI